MLKKTIAIALLSIAVYSAKADDRNLFMSGETMGKTKELPTRNEIADKYKWNLADFFKSPAEWEKAYKLNEVEIEKIGNLKSSLSKSAENLLNVIKKINELDKSISLIYFYAASENDMDINNGESNVRYEKAMKLNTDFRTAVSWFTPEIMELSDETLNSFLKSNKELSNYKFMLEEMRMMKPYTLSAEQEKLLATLSPIGQAVGNTYRILNNAELPFPTVKDPEGNEVRISHGLYRAAIYNENREFRKAVYKGTYVPYRQLNGTFASFYNGRLKQRMIDAQIRGFNSSLEASLFSNSIPIDVYKNLINAAKSNINVLHRWAAIKKKALKLDELHPYDQYVTLFAGSETSISYDSACSIILKALAPLGEEYVNAVKYSFENRWIDVYETKGKRSGAYSNSALSVHPLILINWNNTLDDMFTLAHEIGHNMHSYFSEKNQPYHYADYPIFLAEVASTTNEALLLDYLIKKATSKQEKMFLIEKFLINCQTTFFRQIQFAEFEMIMHDKAEKGEILSADQINELFGKLYKEYWGPAMTMDDDEAYSWARIHHLVEYNFYVYQYATGFSAAQALSEMMIKEGKPAVDRYLKNFIYVGSTDYPLNILKKAGVDMSTTQPVNQTLQKASRYLDELEKLMNE